MNPESASKTIDSYISTFPEHTQEILKKIRKIIGDAAPDATEAMKYQIPTFVLGENLVHFAAFAKHIGFYPTPSAIQQFQEELAVYKNAKGSVQFPIDTAIPYSLIKRIVKFRVAECRKKMESKSVKKQRPKSRE